MVLYKAFSLSIVENGRCFIENKTMEYTDTKLKKGNFPIELNEIIAKVVEEIGVERIYLNRGTDRHTFTYRLTIITRLEQKDFSEQIRPVINSILKQYPDYTYRVFASSYAFSELSQGNLYFLNNCHKNDLVYETGNDNLPGNYLDSETKALYEKIKQNFKRDMSRLKSFKKGVHFFRTQKNLPQSAFMMHQAFEQGYRIIERFICGSTKICHSIKNHQAYVLKSLGKLEGIFHIESDTDSKLLDLLEDAYSSARYSNSYDISNQEIEQLSQKLRLFINEIQSWFEHELSIFKKNMIDDVAKHHSERITDRSNQYEGGNVLRRTEFASSLEMLYRARSMISLCLTCLQKDVDPPGVDVNYIQTTLKSVLELLTFEETNPRNHER